MLWCSVSLKAQSIGDAEEEQNYNDFYKRELRTGKQAMPFIHVRDIDVVWETAIWRKIDFREKFNQFFFYPTETERNAQGRINLVNTLLQALRNGEIEVFEDDDMKVPVDFEQVWGTLNRERPLSIPIYNEWDEIIGTKDSIVHEEFDPESVLGANLKEWWYIDREDTRQKVRIVGLSLFRNDCRDRDGERECNTISMFWVPMNDMRVRNVLVKARAFDERNNVSRRSYDDIFVERYFDSFVTRVTNTKNRPINSYLTGVDAILESQAIEDELFNIESDMWEY